MNKKTLILCMLLGIHPLLAVKPLWGFYAHKKINRLAVFTLPHPLVNFYKRHLSKLEDLAVLPDQRRYSLDAEASRHYIDLDRYAIGQIKNTTWEQAINKFHPDSLTKHGIVPWHIAIMYKRLVYAFSARDSLHIIQISAEIGHYIADAHVPLHTTSNYDGQKTNQIGIHAFWESRIPELLQDDISSWMHVAVYLPNIQESAWNWVLASHEHVETLLHAEKMLSQQTKDAHKYQFNQKGKVLQKEYSKAYSLAYHKRLNGMIENRFQEAVQSLGNVLYSAWLDAGQPDFQ